MGRTRIAQALIRDLKEKKENSQKRKSELIDYLKRLNQAHFNKKLSGAEYVEALHKKNDGRNIKEWVDYYENYSKNCKKEIKNQKKELIKSKIPVLFFSVLLISVFIYLSISTSFFNLNFTGLLIGEQREQQFSQDINITLNESTTYDWQLENPGELTSLKINGLIEGDGEVKIYLENLLILDSTNISYPKNKPSKLTGQIIEENPIAGPIENTNNSYSEKEAPSKEESSPSQGELLTENTTQNNSSNQSYSEEQMQPSQPGSETTNKSEALPKEESSPSQEEPQPSETNITDMQNKNKAITSIIKFTGVCTETCNLTDFNLNESSYNLKIEITNAKLHLDTIDYTLIPTETSQETNLSSTENATINTTQYKAVLGQPVKWKKQISLNESGPTIVKLPKEAENIVVNKIIESYSEKEAPSKEESSPSQGELLTENKRIENKTNADTVTEENKATAKFSLTGQIISNLGEKRKSSNSFLKNIFSSITGKATSIDEKEETIEVVIQDNATDYEIEYETPAPYAIEENTSKGKKVKIVGSEEVHYENVLSFTELDKSLNIKNPSKIKIYWVENQTYVQINSIQDRDSDGIYDYVEWTAPHLSNQTFEIIIITKAEHLSTDKIFISDIYEQVKSLDNIWSETISSNEYVRVTFETNLTRNNDITIFPRIVSGNPTIEVYEKDKTKKIAEFKNINSNEYNKVYLTNLEGIQDTFDLKITGGSVEFDHIVDPDTGFLLPTSYGETYNEWNAPNELLVSDNIHGYPDADGAQEDYYDFGFGIPAGATIDGITVEIDGDSYDGSLVEYGIELSGDGGTSYTTTGHSGSTTSTTDVLMDLGGATDTWGQSWTDTDFSDSNFRLKLEQIQGGNNGNVDSISVKVYYTLEDVTPPYFTTIPANASLFYANQSLLVTFVATDAGGFGYYRINDTRFSINQTGFLRNATPMAVGNYEINVSINDTSNNINWTRYKVQINKSKYYSCEVYFNATSPLNYPSYFLVYTNCSSTYTLYRNGSSITNNSAVRAGAGYYNLTVQRTDTANYTNIFDDEFFTVNKNAENCRVLFNETSPLSSARPFLVWANCTSAFVLRRNGTTISNYSVQNLVGGAYNFSFSRNDSSNYSIIFNQSQFIINSGSDTTPPYFTTIPANASLFYANQSLLVTFVGTDAGGFGYYRVNDTKFSINQTGFLSNATPMAVGNYEINVSINDTSNNIAWTRYKVQVNKSQENCQVLFNETSPLSSPKTFKVWANCTSAFVLSRNGTTITNNSEQALAVSAYNFSMLRNDTSNYTILFNQTQFIINSDSVPPYFTTIPANASLFYGNQSLLVTFVGTDAGGFGYYRVNDTRFLINQTGFLSNANPMAVGNYEINVSINDTSNNINWTRYKVQVNKSQEKCQVLFNETSPLSSPKTFKVWANCTSAFVLSRNGTTITNNSEQALAVSAYNFSMLRNDTSNYTILFNQTQFIINSDSTPPTYSQVSINNTLNGSITKFSINVNDNSALHNNGGYIFSTNNTWGNATWKNDSFISFTTTPFLTNTTKTLNSTVGKVIGYRWYFNDSAGNTNSTPIYILTTTSTNSVPPSISFEYPTPPDGSSTTNPVTIVANISDTSNTSSWIDFDRSLFGYWAMDYYNKTGIYDNSTYNNFGKFSPGSGLNYTNLTTGARGQALEFDGNNDYIDLGSPSTLNSITYPYTISLWVKPETLTQNTIIMSLDPSGTDSDIAFGFYGSGADEIDLGTASYAYGLYGISDYLTAGIWQHWVIVLNSLGETEFYLDGTEIALTDFGNSYYIPGGNIIGARNTSPYYFFNGAIDEVMVFNRTLSQTEILALYNSKSNKFNISSMNLSRGQHNYTVYAIDQEGNANNSGLRNFILNNGSQPRIYNVTSIPSLTLTEGPGKTFVVVNFSVYDADGASNLKNSSAAINFTKAGEALRYNSSCAVKAYSGNYANYTCNVTMWWLDAPGNDWRVYANISDWDSNIAINDTTTFMVNSLTGFIMSPSTLTFSNLPAGSTNQTPTSYFILNNTGNTNVTNPIQIDANDLVGETDHSKILWASNFSASNSTGGKIECNVTASATAMINNTFVSVSNTLLPAGNYTKNDGTAQEQIYLCARKVGIELTQQTYSTNAFGSWTVRIVLVAISVRRRKKKKYSNNPTNITIPTTIFSKKLGALESISKYMKENLGISYHNIAELLNRDERTIWTSYNKATEKQKESIEVKTTEIFIPISVLNNRELTILESVINYLREKDMKYSEIAKLINRDQRNVRTIYNKTKNNI